MVRFNPNEEIRFIAHKHWFVLARRVVFLDLLILAPLLLPVFYYAALNKVLTIPGNLLTLFMLLSALWLLALWIVFFITWTDYYLDVLVLTNQRLMHATQRGLFSREVSTLQVTKIQDITIDIRGIIPTLLTFGDIHIQTAGEEKEFMVKNIGEPYKVKNEILIEAQRRY